MVATYFGNITLVNQIIEKGANPHLIDNAGRNAFQIAIQRSLLDKRFAQEKLGRLYDLLSPGNMNFQVEDRLVKIDVQRMEFFLINAMISIAHKKKGNTILDSAFTVDDFIQPLHYFPETIISERRKRRAYISSILAKNEVNRCDIYNRKLFLRVRRGYYILNPELLIKLNDTWIELFQFLNLEDVKRQFLYFKKLFSDENDAILSNENQEVI
jgi:hypothetical protein